MGCYKRGNLPENAKGSVIRKTRTEKGNSREIEKSKNKAVSLYSALLGYIF